MQEHIAQNAICVSMHDVVNTKRVDWYVNVVRQFTVNNPSTDTVMEMGRGNQCHLVENILEKNF